MPSRCTSDAAGPSLAAALKALEIPDCACPFSKVPFCLREGPLGCRDRQLNRLRRLGWRDANGLWRVPDALLRRLRVKPWIQEGEALAIYHENADEWAGESDCDCPYMPGDPCEHVLATWHELAIEAWASMLWQAFPKEYEDPPRPHDFMVCLHTESRVDQMITRHASGRHIRHSQDRRHDRVVSVETEKGRREGRLTIANEAPIVVPDTNWPRIDTVNADHREHYWAWRATRNTKSLQWSPSHDVSEGDD